MRIMARFSLKVYSHLHSSIAFVLSAVSSLEVDIGTLIAFYNPVNNRTISFNLIGSVEYF